MASDVHQTLMQTAAEPPFHDELESVWGRPWGAHDEVGRLEVALVRPPGPALSPIRADPWDAGARALVDPEGGWYWTRRDPPDMPMARGSPRTAQRLSDAGVEVVTVEYDELHPNGGGVHCSTMELVRRPAG